MELQSGLPTPPPLAHDQSVLLDFDGTLVEIAPRPDAVTVDPELHVLLAALQVRLAGRVAIVSGRSVAQLQSMLGLSASGLTLIGSHGAEIRQPDGRQIAPHRPLALAEAALTFAKAFAHRPGVLIEDKSLGVAVHYRQAPSAESEARAVVEHFARRHGLAVQEGKMMVELRLPGHDKGTAIAALLQTSDFSDHRPIFLGDDLTDEPGFVACAAQGGAGILVGAPRPTAARYRLGDVDTVRRWLTEAAR